MRAVSTAKRQLERLQRLRVVQQQLSQRRKSGPENRHHFCRRVAERVGKDRAVMLDQNNGQGRSLNNVLLPLLRKTSSRCAGVELVPDEAPGRREIHGNTVPAGKDRCHSRLARQVVVERNRPCVPLQLRHRHDLTQPIAMREYKDPQALRPCRLTAVDGMPLVRLGPGANLSLVACTVCRKDAGTTRTRAAALSAT